MSTLNLTVVSVQAETPDIRSFVLQAGEGQLLPPFTPGSHVKVSIPGQALPRSYSLVCLDEDPASFDAPSCYRLGVRLEEATTGGSQYMHGLKVGDTLEVDVPRNDFCLHEASADERPIVLIAGGIGITPIAAMAACLKRAERPFELHYYGRSRSHMAFLASLSKQHGDALRVHADDEPDTLQPLVVLFDAMEANQHLYVCGPKGLIDAVIDLAQERQWPSDHVHFELFAPPAPQEGDKGFDVELRQSGLVFHVPPGKSILQVLEENGCDPLFDCRRGECGVCQVNVLEGKPDHRDYYLSDEERDAGNVMQICVSRSHTDRLVLDL